MEFEWDEEKAANNLRKHGISFRLAVRVFSDERRIERLDDSEDYGERRWITIGLVEGQEILVVYTQRNEKLRLISARGATRDERREYWQDSAI